MLFGDFATRLRRMPDRLAPGPPAEPTSPPHIFPYVYYVPAYGTPALIENCETEADYIINFRQSFAIRKSLLEKLSHLA